MGGRLRAERTVRKVSSDPAGHRIQATRVSLVTGIDTEKLWLNSSGYLLPSPQSRSDGQQQRNVTA